MTDPGPARQPEQRGKCALGIEEEGQAKTKQQAPQQNKNKNVPDPYKPDVLTTMKRQTPFSSNLSEISDVSVAGNFAVFRINHAENRIEIASWEVPQ